MKILDRWAARRMCNLIFRAPGETYQFGGYTGALKLSYEMVDASKFQLMHWILSVVGIRCCVYDVMESYGVPRVRALEEEKRGRNPVTKWAAELAEEGQGGPSPS